MSAPRRVQAVGYYGMGNYGDDLFRAVVARHAPSLWPGATVRTWAPQRPGLNARGGVVGQAARLAGATAGAAWADTFALCGGSVLHEVTGVQRLRSRLKSVRRFEALGVSVGPFPADPGPVLRFLDSFDRVVVRDPASRARAGRDYPVGGDLAALCDDLRPHGPRSGKIVVCPSRDAQVDAPEIARQVLSSLPDRDMPVAVLALNYHPEKGDETLSHEVARLLREQRCTHVRTPTYRVLGQRGVASMLASASAVWTQRLHAGIVAYLVGTPFLIVSHHDKCRDFASDIGLAPDLVLDKHQDWRAAAALTLDPTEHWTMDADDYRARARSVYLEK